MIPDEGWRNPVASPMPEMNIIQAPYGLDTRVMPTPDEGVKSAGLLKEIMQS